MLHRLLGHVPRDLLNRLRYGRRAPVARERIWIDPREVEVALVSPTEVGLARDDPHFDQLEQRVRNSQRWIGRVIDDELDDTCLFPVRRLIKVRACLRRWRDGVSWEEAGAIDHLLAKIAITGPISGCRTRADVELRYARLDAIFSEVRRARRLESQLRRGRLVTRERDGVQIHLGPDGRLIFGSSGTHRFAMALVLGLRQIPASLGFVHRSALDRLPRLRAPRMPPALAAAAPSRQSRASREDAAPACSPAAAHCNAAGARRQP